MGCVIQRLGVAPKIYGRRNRDQHGGKQLTRQIDDSLQADLGSAAMDLGQFLWVGVAGDLQPCLPKFGPQAYQALSYGTQVHR